jgi:hypothetical protein
LLRSPNAHFGQPDRISTTRVLLLPPPRPHPWAHPQQSQNTPGAYHCSSGKGRRSSNFIRLPNLGLSKLSENTTATRSQPDARNPSQTHQAVSYNTTQPTTTAAQQQQHTSSIRAHNSHSHSQSRSTQQTRSTNTAGAQQLPTPRWSLTQRIFNFTNWAPALTAGTPATTTVSGRPITPRAHAARLWNPQNFSPRGLTIPNVPVAHPDIAYAVDRPGRSTDIEGDYPLLSPPEQRRSRQSPQASSLAVERSSADHSRRQSIKLPPEIKKSPLSDRFPFGISEVHPDEGGPGPSTEAAREAAQRRLEGMETKEMANPNGGQSPTRDVESGRLQVLKRSPSRASLPQSRDGERDAHTDEADDFEWGPSHPCFPHMNPHVPVNSPLYQSTRVIRIKRDWMQAGDLAPTFTNLYPEILDPHISEEQFRQIVGYINKELITAFSPWSARNWADTILSVATFWIWEDLGFVAVKQRLGKLERWIADWNRNYGLKDGVTIIPLRRTGYLSVSFIRWYMLLRFVS